MIKTQSMLKSPSPEILLKLNHAQQHNGIPLSYPPLSVPPSQIQLPLMRLKQRFSDGLYLYKRIVYSRPIFFASFNQF